MGPSQVKNKNLRKTLPNFLYFGPNLHCFFKEFFHLQIVIINYSRIFFSSLYFFTLLFCEPYFIINFYEGKNHPSSIFYCWHPSLIWQITTLLLINNTIGTIKTTAETES